MFRQNANASKFAFNLPKPDYRAGFHKIKSKTWSLGEEYTHGSNYLPKPSANNCKYFLYSGTICIRVEEFVEVHVSEVQYFFL